MTAEIEIINLTKRYGDAVALAGVDLRLDRGTTTAVLGPSGSGKSTLLRLVAGLDDSDAGTILADGRSLSGVPPAGRGFGLMFQDLALFPHLNVRDNIAFGLRMQRWAPERIRTRVEELATMVRIAALLDRKTDALSGGEQQRVALARSMAPEPGLLMLDEPLGALDRTLREMLVYEIRRVLRETGMTALYVTHDQDEAFALADRVAILNAGQVAQQGTPSEVFFWPASAFVARFLGHRNLIPAVIVGPVDGGVGLETALGRWIMPADIAAQATGPCTMLIPATSLSFDPSEPAQAVDTKVIDSAFRGGMYVVQLRTRASEMDLVADIVLTPSRTPPRVGEAVTIHVKLNDVRILPWTLGREAD